MGSETTRVLLVEEDDVTVREGEKAEVGARIAAALVSHLT
jgi:hypothetical protein